MCMNLQLTGLWSKLASRKRVMVEPRAADREDFDGMMKAFYEVVKGDLYTDYCDDGKSQALFISIVTRRRLQLHK